MHMATKLWRMAISSTVQEYQFRLWHVIIDEVIYSTCVYEVTVKEVIWSCCYRVYQKSYIYVFTIFYDFYVFMIMIYIFMFLLWIGSV